MRASGDSEYVFATATLPRPVGLGLKLGSPESVIFSELATWKIQSNRQTVGRVVAGLFYAE